MVSRWWERVPTDDANAWDAEDFEQEVKASQERPPMPWQPAPTTLQKPATGPATGPAAARAFGQEASRTLQDWQQAMLRLIRGPGQSPQAPRPAAQANSQPTAEQLPESPYGGPTGQPEQPTGPTQAPKPAELLPWQRGIIAAARLPEPLAARVFQPPETTEGRQFAGGVGEAARALGSGLEWSGLKGTGKTVREAGEKIVQEYPAEGPQFKDWRSFFDPEYLRTSAVRSMGTSAPTMVAGIAVALAAPAALGALGVGATAAVIGGAGASIGTSRILESLQEAGGTYQEAQQRGMDDTQAEEAARFTFLANLPLSAADAIQIIPFMRGLSGPVKAAVSKGLAQRVGPKAAGGLARALGIGASAASEGGEEVAQQAIQQTALGEPVRFDESMQESFGMGALMGGGIHGGVAVAERVAREGLPKVGFTVEDVSGGQPSAPEPIAEPTPLPAPPAAEATGAEASDTARDDLRILLQNRLERGQSAGNRKLLEEFANEPWAQVALGIPVTKPPTAPAAAKEPTAPEQTAPAPSPAPRPATPTPVAGTNPAGQTVDEYGTAHWTEGQRVVTKEGQHGTVTEAKRTVMAPAWGKGGRSSSYTHKVRLDSGETVYGWDLRAEGEESPPVAEPAQPAPTEAVRRETDAEKLRRLEAKQRKTRGDELNIEILKRQVAADPTKWQTGQGVGRRIGLGGKWGGQINRGFRITEINAPTKLAKIHQVADTGLTESGGNNDRIRDEWVHIADLVPDHKYDAPNLERKVPTATAPDPLAPFRRDVARAKDETVQRWLADYQARGADPERIAVLQQEAEKRGLTTGAAAAETIAPNVEPETTTPTDSPVSSSSPLATPREPLGPAPAGETAEVKEPWEMTKEEADTLSAAIRQTLNEPMPAAVSADTANRDAQLQLEQGKLAKLQREYDRVQMPTPALIKRLELQREKVSDIQGRIAGSRDEQDRQARYTADLALRQYPELFARTEKYPYIVGNERYSAVMDHKRAVQRALAEGKLVPPEVLVDYPDLAQPTATSATEEQAAAPLAESDTGTPPTEPPTAEAAPAEEPKGEPGITKLLSPVAAETEPVNPDEAIQEAAAAEPAKTGTETTSAPAESTSAAPTPKKRKTKTRPTPVVGETSSPDASLVPVAPPPEPPAMPPAEAGPEPTEAPRAGQRDLFRDGIDANMIEATPKMRDRLGSLWDGFRREFEDRNRDVYVFERLYEQLTNSTLSTQERVTTYLALKPGAGRAANLLLKDEYRPILQKVVRGAKDKKESQAWLDDFQTILVALDQVDKDAAVKERWVAEHTVEGELPPTPPDRLWSWKTDPRLAPETLREIRDGSAKRAGVGAERFDVLMDAARDYWRLMAKVLAVKRDAGLISAEDYTLLTEKFPHYSPIRILAYLRDSAGQVGTGTNRLSVAQNGIKHLTDEGTNKALQNPLEAAIDLVYQTYGLAARNRAAIQVARMADRATADAVPGLDTLIREVPESYHVKANEAVMSAMDNGKRRRFVVPEELRAIVESGDNQLVGFVALFARVLTEPLRMGATGLNALFLPTNTIGDFVTYMVREPTASPWQYLKAAREVFTEGEAYKAMIRAGVGVGFYEHEANRRETVRKMVNGPWYSVQSVADLGKLAKGLVTLRPVAAAGTAVESIPRLATYMGRQARGETSETAALAARRVTMDFNRGGRTSMFWNQFVPFTNVAFQAPWQVIRSFHEQGNWLGVSLRLATLVVLPTLLAEAWNDLHPEYEDVPDYIKNRSIVVMMPWSGQKKDRLGNPIPEYVEIRAREWSPFVMLAREGIDGFKKENQQGWGKFVAAVMQNWSPVQGAGGAEVVSSGLPPLATTLLEIGTNRDLYRGGPIVPEAREHLPAAEQYQPWTTETAKAIGRAIGVPPAQIDHFVQGNFAGLGKQALGAGDLVLASVGQTPSSRPAAPKPGEQLWAWWVPKGTGEPEMRAESDIARLTAEANRGAGALYVVAGKDEQQAKDRVYAKEYVKTVGEQRPITQIPLIGNLAQTVYGTRAGQQAQDRQAAADRVLGKGTAATTRRAWEMARPKLDQIAEEERVLDRALAKGGKDGISGNEWREQRSDLMTRKRGILEGVGAAFPAAAMIGEKATKYKEAIATLAGSVPDRREQTEVLAAIYLAMEPPKAANGLPDMDAFFKSRDLYMEALDPAQRVALEQHLSKNASPTERAYYAAQDAMGEYMAIPRWIGVTKEKSDQMVEAQRQMLAISQTLPPKATNKQARAIVLLAKQDKDMAKLALESTKRKRNPARNLYRYKHPEIERFYSDLLKAESVPEVAA